MFQPTKEVFRKKCREGNLIPVTAEIMADLETPVSAFLKLGGGPYSFLLETAAEGSGPGETLQVRELRSEYQGSLRPQLRPGILTPMQETFLHRFFAFDVGQRFVLTGGTALAAFYLGHRLSDDLDLFTLEDGALAAALDAALSVSAAAGWQITHERRSPHFLRTFVAGPGGDSLKVEFIQEVGAQFGEKGSCNGIVIDSFINIAVNKVTAIFGRAAGKDFVDLYVILHRSSAASTFASSTENAGSAVETAALGSRTGQPATRSRSR